MYQSLREIVDNPQNVPGAFRAIQAGGPGSGRRPGLNPAQQQLLGPRQRVFKNTYQWNSNHPKSEGVHDSVLDKLHNLGYRVDNSVGSKNSLTYTHPLGYKAKVNSDNGSVNLSGPKDHHDAFKYNIKGVY